MWEFSSAGRASALQAGGHRFEPCNSHQFGQVVQLVRMPACHAGGRRFEPDLGRQFNPGFGRSYGGYRQAVKPSGCGSDMRGFESHYPPHFFVGVSPSGKATDSDSVMRRFESCYPSQLKRGVDTTPRTIWRHSQVVRQRSAKPLSPGSNPGVASIKSPCYHKGFCVFCVRISGRFFIITRRLIWILKNLRAGRLKM